MYLLFYPEEEEFLRFRDFRGKFVGERRARRAYRFQNSAEDQKSAADTISVHEKKIRRVAAARRPWLNFEHDPAALVCPIQRISKRFKQPRFSNANNLFSLLSLSYPNYYPNGKKEYSWFVTRNRKYEPRVFFREKKKGGDDRSKKYSKESNLYATFASREIFSRKWIHPVSIYIYIYIYSKIYRFVIETWTPLPPPLSVHDLLFRPAFAAGSFYAITLPTLGGKMAERVEEGRRHIASKARVKSGAAVVCPSRIVMHFLYERSVATIQTASSGRRY